MKVTGRGRAGKARQPFTPAPVQLATTLGPLTVELHPQYASVQLKDKLRSSFDQHLFIATFTSGAVGPWELKYDYSLALPSEASLSTEEEGMKVFSQRQNGYLPQKGQNKEAWVILIRNEKRRLQRWYLTLKDN